MRPCNIQAWADINGVSYSAAEGDVNELFRLGVVEKYGRGYRLLKWLRPFSASDKYALERRGMDRIPADDSPLIFDAVIAR